ncbi:MAG: ROK family protein [Planctomycetota bacterium]|jgi:glucokinase|nr:ROK family protein [Planctomycetota bacterium]
MAKREGERLFGGIDVGATKILAIVADTNGNVISQAKKKTRGETGFKTVCERIASTLAEAAEMEGLGFNNLDAVGIGIPMPVLPGGVTPTASNLPGWENAPFVKTMNALIGRPCSAANDCNAGTYGEYVYGVGKGSKTLIGFFVGTGLGGGIVFHDQLIVGENSMAAELGHIIVQEGGRLARGCGHRGCLEAYASKAGMARRMAWEIFFEGRKSILTQLVPDGNFATIKASLLQEAYRKGDPVAVETLDELAHYLGIGIANYISIFGPDLVVIGGGVFESLGKELLPKVRESARLRVFPAASFKDTRICLTKMGDNAVALGAMALARRQFDEGTGRSE